MMHRKPPLPVRSPIRLRPRRAVQSTVNKLQTPSTSLTKSHLPKRQSDMEEQVLRPEYRTISHELRALTKMVQENLGGPTNTNQSEATYTGSPLFQRGKFYEEYSARRNERLKRKNGENGTEKKTLCEQYLGVRIESAKKRGELKKFESARKMSTPLTQRREAMETPRYALRSSSCKEMKKPVAMSYDRLVNGTVEKKTTVRRTTRK